LLNLVIKPWSELGLLLLVDINTSVIPSSCSEVTLIVFNGVDVGFIQYPWTFKVSDAPSDCDEVWLL
jgi:hypothetical protein